MADVELTRTEKQLRPIKNDLVRLENLRTSEIDELKDDLHSSIFALNLREIFSVRYA